MSATKDLSIFRVSTGRWRRCDRLEKPVPKSSIATRKPMRRSLSSVRLTPSTSRTMLVSVISRVSQVGAQPVAARIVSSSETMVASRNWLAERFTHTVKGPMPAACQAAGLSPLDLQRVHGPHLGPGLALRGLRDVGDQGGGGHRLRQRQQGGDFRFDRRHPGHTLEGDVADRHGRVEGNRVENGEVPGGEPPDGLLVEQFAGVGPRGPHAAVGTVGQRVVGIEDQAQIGLDGGRRDGFGFHAQTGEFDDGEAEVLKSEHHLEDRVVPRRAAPSKCGDDLLECDVGVCQVGQVGTANLVEQVGEWDCRVDGRTEWNSVDEHSHHVVECVGGPADVRGADDDIVLAGHFAQQDGQGRVGHHEQGGVVGPSQPGQGRHQLGRDLEFDVAAGEGRRRGPGPIGRDPQQFGCAIESLVPVAELAFALGDAVAVGDIEPVGRPHRVVGELDRQRCPVRR